MFCSSCGKEISATQKFCCHCGGVNPMFTGELNGQIVSKEKSVINDPANTVTQDFINNVQVNNVFNHDVLVNYLYNLRVLEFAHNKLSHDKLTVESRLSFLNRVKFRPILRLKNIISALFSFVFVALFCIVFIHIEDVRVFGISILAIAVAMFGYFIVVSIYRHIINTKKFNQQEQEELAEKEQLLNFLPKIDKDIDDTVKLKNDAYSMNIIPQKFRNIYGIYFLYDYISTSTATLSEAAYQCSLDEISRKLDTVIDQQREIIMELARSNALSEQIISQNDQMLRHAAATEKNTALAAQYAEVAAINSKTTAQIQSYYFFKN